MVNRTFTCFHSYGHLESSLIPAPFSSFTSIEQLCNWIERQFFPSLKLIRVHVFHSLLSSRSRDDALRDFFLLLSANSSENLGCTQRSERPRRIETEKRPTSVKLNLAFASLTRRAGNREEAQFSIFSFWAHF